MKLKTTLLEANNEKFKLIEKITFEKDVEDVKIFLGMMFDIIKDDFWSINAIAIFLDDHHDQSILGKTLITMLKTEVSNFIFYFGVSHCGESRRL